MRRIRQRDCILIPNKNTHSKGESTIHKGILCSENAIFLQAVKTSHSEWDIFQLRKIAQNYLQHYWKKSYYSKFCLAPFLTQVFIFFKMFQCDRLKIAFDAFTECHKIHNWILDWANTFRSLILSNRLTDWKIHKWMKKVSMMCTNDWLPLRESTAQTMAAIVCFSPKQYVSIFTFLSYFRPVLICNCKI